MSGVVTFDAADGTRLAYHRAGQGRPLLCLPGGPMQASAYLGDLGGLSAHRSLVLLDLRGTGASAVPADPATYRCDRQVGDLEAVRAQLGLDVTDLDRQQVAELRRGEPWFPGAAAALGRIRSGAASDADWEAIAPFTYGRWDATAQAHHAQEATQRNDEAAAGYYAPGALDLDATRAALAQLAAPVLLVAGEYDVALPPACAAGYARLLPRAELAVQPGGGHFPWLDDPGWFVASLAGFLG
jgi:pimeloyl-ACP methyl ester carboxylesterase